MQVTAQEEGHVIDRRTKVWLASNRARGRTEERQEERKKGRYYY
jgi:hypothetical protein